MARDGSGGLVLSAEKRKELELHDAKLAEAYDKRRERDTIGKHYQEYWMARMLSHAVPIKRPTVLDYCCGTSILYPHLKKAFGPGVRYVGIDLSPEMLAVGKRRYGRQKGFRVLQRDGEDLRLNRKFDLVIARGAIHHLPDPVRGMREIAKVLKKGKQKGKQGGVLIISEPAANILLKGIRWLMYRLSSHFSSSHRSFTHGELMRIMESANYEVIAVERFGFLAYPFGFPDIMPFSKLMPRWLFPALIRIDEWIGRIPLIRALSFSVIITARPETGANTRPKRYKRRH